MPAFMLVYDFKSVCSRSCFIQPGVRSSFRLQFPQRNRESQLKDGTQSRLVKGITAVSVAFGVVQKANLRHENASAFETFFSNRSVL